MNLLGQLNFASTVGTLGWGDRPQSDHDLALNIARKWMALRKAKNFSAADDLRQKADEAGLFLSVERVDGEQTGQAKFSQNFDPAKLEGLV